MSLNFINPIFLWGLLGLSLPVMIHLLTRRQQTFVPFSAVYLLTQAQRRSIKRSQPNRLLLLIFRCLGIIFLCLALANPRFSFGNQDNFLSNQPAANVFILDHSYSMAAQGKEKALFQHAVDVLDSFLEKIPSQQSVSVVLASNPPELLQDWTGDRESLRKKLKSLRPSYKTTDIGGAFTRALDLLANAPYEEAKRIFLLTDLDENGWIEEDFPPFQDRSIQVKVLDFSEMQTVPNQAAIESVNVSQEFLTHSRMIRVRYRVRNLSSTRALNSLNVSLWVDGKQQAEDTLTLLAGETEEKEFSFPHLGKGQLTGQVKLQEDGLLTDNRRIFTYQPDQRLRVLLVDGDPRGVSHQNEIFYIERAMNPFSRSVSDIEPQVVTLSELPAQDLSRFSALILCNVRQLPYGYEQELERFVSQGGALFITLGDQVNTRSYNEKLGGLLPVSLKSINQVDINEAPFRLDAVPSGHPALKVFAGKTLREMEHVRVHTFFSLEPKPERPFIVPMRLTNEAPLLVESDFGKGKVLLYTTSIDRDWNNFPIQPTFLPWVQRWVKYTAQSLDTITRKNLFVAESIQLETNEDTWWVENPGGRALPLDFEEGKPARFKQTDQPGVYSIFSALKETESPSESNRVATGKIPPDARHVGGFTVNVNTTESSPEKIGESKVRDILRGLSIDISHQPQVWQTSHSKGGAPLATPFLLVVALALCVEGWMVRRE